MKTSFFAGLIAFLGLTAQTFDPRELYPVESMLYGEPFSLSIYRWRLKTGHVEFPAPKDSSYKKFDKKVQSQLHWRHYDFFKRGSKYLTSYEDTTRTFDRSPLSQVKIPYDSLLVVRQLLMERKRFELEHPRRFKRKDRKDQYRDLITLYVGSDTTTVSDFDWAVRNKLNQFIEAANK